MTKDKILDVASVEFSKYGYDAVSMNNLVKKIDINKATVYYHYKDKKTLYIEVIKSVVEAINEKTRLLFTQNLEGKEFFKAYIQIQVECIKDMPHTAALALREIANLGADIDDTVTPLFEEDLKYLQMALDKLDIKDSYKDLTLYAFHCLIVGTIFTFYSIQMSDLSVGTKDDLKKDADKSLNFISDFVSNIILDAICK